MELTQSGLRKSEKCEGMKTRRHAKYMRDGDVYFTDSHLIWCHYARATLIFEKKREGRTERQRLSYATKPLGASGFFWRSRAMQRPDRVCDHDSPTLPRLLGHSSRPEVGMLTRLWHDFLNFLLDCDGKRMKARSVRFQNAWCVVESPSQMALCQAKTAAPDSHRWRTQEGKWQRCLSREP